MSNTFYTYSNEKELCPREKEILHLLVNGESAESISHLLHMNETTVQSYRASIFRKYNVDNIFKLIRFAVEHNLVH